MADVIATASQLSDIIVSNGRHIHGRLEQAAAVDLRDSLRPRRVSAELV
jgi:hypothetical protein